VVAQTLERPAPTAAVPDRRPIIQIRDVAKTFQTASGQLKAVDGVSLDIQKGSVHGIIGLSGAGKSTLLRLINLLERPERGEVLIEGKDLTKFKDSEVRKARLGIGMIFQNFHLLNNLTVEDNVALPLEIAGVPKKDRKGIVQERLATVGLLDKAKAYPAKLSGGQKQRVAIARALATKPQILLCDEPTSSVDPQTTGSILAYLKEVNEQFGINIIVVTHEMNVIKAICNTVTVMEAGRVVEEFDPNDESYHPRSAIAQFLSHHDIALNKSEDIGTGASIPVATAGAIQREAISVG